MESQQTVRKCKPVFSCVVWVQVSEFNIINTSL